MKVLERVSDRVLARFVPHEEAGACKEYYRCYKRHWWQVCYVGCGRPTFCRTISRCGA
jgi:hypothetical protein